MLFWFGHHDRSELYRFEIPAQTVYIHSAKCFSKPLLILTGITTKTKTYLNANQINHKVNSSGQENSIMSALPFSNSSKHPQMKPSSGSSSAPSTPTVIPNRPPTMGQPKISSQNHNSSHKVKILII